MAVSLKKPHEEPHKADRSEPSVPGGLPEYTPVHLIDEEETTQLRSARQNNVVLPKPTIPAGLPECTPVYLLNENETIQSRSTKQNSYKAAVVGTSKKLIVIIIVMAVVIVGLVAVGIILFAGKRTGGNFDPANGIVGETSYISELEQSSTSTNSEQPPQSTDSTFDTSHVYETMGSVTIMGREYDIAATGLYLIAEDITDDELKPIAQLTNLVVLNLDYNYISDITPLTGLTNLTKLQMQGNRIDDITPLSKLTNLTTLNLWGNNISDITPLSGLTNLKSLKLCGNQISDITPLSGLTNLNELDLCANQISDLTPLFELTNLTTLNLDYNLISDSDIEQLKTKLPGCEISFNPYIQN